MMARRGVVKVEAAVDMAAIQSPQHETNNPDAVSKSIPLFCSVCPDAPRFSDVSHLLTHIASKGHLHHETQMKLKSHQDIAASIALQQYEQWYRENNIETLLVERMKAKQVKEAARNKRTRMQSSVPPAKTSKKRAKRTSNTTTPKTEYVETFTDFPGYLNFMQSDNESEIVEEMFGPGDMLSLKGQVWPGIGKMDLANEEMKRTRNQRKPKSVIDKMRRTSEGIEPTQVILRPDFDVERVKGVYDDETPPPSEQDDQSPPRKTTRQKRKKAHALAEISANVPRGQSGRNARSNVTTGKNPHPKLKVEPDTQSEAASSVGAIRASHDVFRDEGTKSGSREDSCYSTPAEHELRLDSHDQFGRSTFDSMAHATMVSPTPPPKESSSRLFSGRDPFRQRFQAQQLLGGGNTYSMGSFGRNETPSYSLHENHLYNPGAGRMPFAATVQYSAFDQDQFLQSTNTHHHDGVKYDEYTHPSVEEPLMNSGHSPFLNLPAINTNPLFSQDRMFLNALNPQNPHHLSFSPFGFTPINRSRENSYTAPRDQEQLHPAMNGVKTESQLCEPTETSSNEAKDVGFNNNSIWHGQHAGDPTLTEELRSEDLDL